MREYEVKGETSLYKLHDFLQNDFDFSPDQMVAFRGYDESTVCLIWETAQWIWYL